MRDRQEREDLGGNWSSHISQFFRPRFSAAGNQKQSERERERESERERERERQRGVWRISGLSKQVLTAVISSSPKQGDPNCSLTSNLLTKSPDPPTVLLWRIPQPHLRLRSELHFRELFRSSHPSHGIRKIPQSGPRLDRSIYAPKPWKKVGLRWSGSVLLLCSALCI